MRPIIIIVVVVAAVVVVVVIIISLLCYTQAVTCINYHIHLKPNRA